MAKRVVVALLALSLAACEGERVASSRVDDAGGPEVDADNECAPVEGNLIPDGDFAGGAGAWYPEDAKTVIVPGRCGRKALRLYEIKRYGRVYNDYKVPLPKGTRLRLRAWFKKGTTTPAADPPCAFIRSWRLDDAGGDLFDDYCAVGNLTDTWQLSERTFTLDNAQDSFSIFLASMMSAATGFDEFEIADVSLVKLE